MEKQIQMIILPFAGGNSNSFNKLIPFLDARIDVTTIEYAGRMTRRNESYITEYEPFFEDVTSQIAKHRKKEKPYVILGYSLGSVLLYDLLSRGLIDGELLHAFICAKGSLFYRTKSENYVYTSENKFIQDILSLGGTDERIQKNERFLKIYMEPVKADYKIWGQYVFKQGKIPCNATAIYSAKDPVAQGVQEWAKLVEGTIDFYEMGENHFFIYKNWQNVGNIINRHVDKYLK